MDVCLDEQMMNGFMDVCMDEWMVNGYMDACMECMDVCYAYVRVVPKHRQCM